MSTLQKVAVVSLFISIAWNLLSASVKYCNGEIDKAIFCILLTIFETLLLGRVMK